MLLFLCYYRPLEKIVTAHTNEIMKHSYPIEWSIIRYFVETIKNPFVLWEYYKKILLALRIPIIQEPVEKDLYIQDILDDDDLNDEEKQDDITFRKEHHKEAIVWFHRAKFGESLKIGSSTIRMIKNGERTLENFGYTEEMLKNQNMEQILSVKNIHANEIPQKQLIDCNISSVNVYKRTEPVGSIIRQKMDAVYIPNDTEIDDLLDIQGRNSDCGKLLVKLMRSIIRYQSCAIGEALRFRSKLVIRRVLNDNTDLLAKMDVMMKNIPIVFAVSWKM